MGEIVRQWQKSKWPVVLAQLLLGAVLIGVGLYNCTVSGIDPLWVSLMSSINIWDDRAGLESCWFECENNPTSAYSYPSKDQDFLYLTGYR